MSNGDSVGASLSLLEQLSLCQSAWAPGPPWDRESAHAALWGRHTGSFLVLLDSSSVPQLLCVCVGDTVTDFQIKCSDAELYLTDSHLGFSDLLQLVAFYSLSRDVLPVCLLIPSQVFSLTDTPQDQLGPKFWLCSELPSFPPASSGLSTCSIQVTSASGAVCVINPLYLHLHGDEWLTQKPRPGPAPTCHPANQKPVRRLSTSRPWKGSGLRERRGVSVNPEQEDGLPWAVETRSAPASPSAPVMLRRSSSETTPTCSSAPQSPHRVSWIEDGVLLAPPTCQLRPPSLELDSLSISSLEEECDVGPAPLPSHRRPLPLADKVKHRLSAVGQAIGGLVSPQKRLIKRAQELSERRRGAFAEAIHTYLEQVQRGGAWSHTSPVELLQDVRGTMSAVREMLLDCAEIQQITDGLGDTCDSEVDAMLELSVHKVLLKPIRDLLYKRLHELRLIDGSLHRLRDNQRSMDGRSLKDLGGSTGAGLPDTPTMERIQQRWAAIHQDYSPSRKVHVLLKVCKTIYHSMNSGGNPDVVFGADDFLPCLTWVLLRSDIITLQLDTDYMMELLDPAQLQGEGGYYLTSVYAALFHISSSNPRRTSARICSEAQHSLSQWQHRRRTTWRATRRTHTPGGGAPPLLGPASEATPTEDGSDPAGGRRTGERRPLSDVLWTVPEESGTRRHTWHDEESQCGECTASSGASVFAQRNK